MRKVRFAPSPTGSLHVGNALSAVANRAFGDWMLLRIDDTDPERNVPGGEDAILADLAWLGVVWDEGPVRQSERSRSEEHTSELQSRFDLVCRLLLEKKKKNCSQSPRHNVTLPIASCTRRRVT